MAKIRHNNYIDSLVEISEKASDQGVVQVYTEDEFFTGRTIKIQGNDLRHFGTTGYLGLEQDIRIKKAACDAIMRYGTQFPLSKTYISHSLYAKLEQTLFDMYGMDVLVTKNSTLGHLGVIPTIVRDEDAVILDQQVHWSVQNTCQLLKTRGIPVEMVRHSDMGMLESKIRDLSSKAANIWYFADGIYSMYGDVAPIDELKALSAKYPQLHLYYDDVHGMSWVGKNGTGYVIDQYGTLPENVIVFTTLSKTFGASGATMVTTNKELYKRVKTFGGPLTFSAQLEPSAVAAATASAEIHLSDEIYAMQKDLAEKVAFCNECMDKTDLPLLERNNCPVFYVGTGAPDMGYNFMRKLMDAGFYANMGMFPAVAAKRTGIRFTISRHNQLEDIEALVNTMNELYPVSLAEEAYTKNRVRKIFNLPLLKEDDQVVAKKTNLKVIRAQSIEELDVTKWNAVMSGENILDYHGMQFLEKTFQGNKEKQHNWKFEYIIIADAQGQWILATFFTKAMWKDDMLAPESVSIVMEKKRESDPFYQTSDVLAMGSLFTEGNHLYLDKAHAQSDEALGLMFDTVELLDETLAPQVIALRDFSMDEQFLNEWSNRKGFVHVMLPEACIVDNLTWTDKEGYLDTLSSKSRKHFRKDIEPFIDRVTTQVSDSLTDAELDQAFELYLNVWKKNFAMNTFSFSKSIFTSMCDHQGWEFLKMYPKDEPTRLIGIMFCYKNGTTYVPSFIGMDYEYTEEFSVYRQMLYHTVLHAQALKMDLIDFGFSASFEKKKIGARVIPKVAFIQAKDNYAMEMLETVQNTSA